LALCVANVAVQFSEALFVSIVIVNKKFILVVILEGNQRFLDRTKAYHFHTIEVVGVNTSWKRL
jgi:hypothetical protein